ncbi:MAG: hypothetical protein ACM3MK_11855 [Chitinophagales bacterium]
MSHNRGSRNSVISILVLGMVYFAASLVLMGSDYRPLSPTLVYLRYGLVFLGLLYFAVIYLKEHYRSRLARPILVVYAFISWFIFSVLVIMSQIYNDFFPTEGFFFLLVIPVFYLLVVPRVVQYRPEKIILASLLAGASFLVLSYLTVPFTWQWYSGLAANPNGFGEVAFQTFVCSWLFFWKALKEGTTKFNLKIIILLTLIGVSSLSIIFSCNRTAVVAVLITLVLTLGFGAFSYRHSWKLILSILLLLGLICLTPVRTILIENVGGKFQQYTSAGDPLNGRLEKWGGVMDNASLLGHGPQDTGAINAHNSLVNVVGEYGILAGLGLGLFLFLSLIISTRYSLRHARDNPLELAPLLITVVFLLLSMTETMFGAIGQGITILFFNCLGIALNAPARPDN